MAKYLSAFITSWLFCLCVSNEIHKQMTIEELKSTFHVDHHDLVPDYEVVPIQHVRKRSLPNSYNESENLIDTDDVIKDKHTLDKKIFSKAHLKLQAFGEPFNLTLVPTEGLFKKGKLKIWTIEPNATAQHGVEYTELPESNEDIGDIYQDEENQAAVLLRNEGDEVLVEGSIGSHLVIRPIPSRLRGSAAASSPAKKQRDSSYDDEMFLDTDGELSSEVAIDTGLPIKRNKHVHHIVIKKNPKEEDSMSDYALMEPDHISKRYKRNVKSQSKNRSKREAPYTIYPEILVIVDYDGYRLHGGDNIQIKRYFVSFWNGVDLRYKLLKGPKVRISIAGIIISRGRDATPYLERNRVGRDAIDSAAALTDMGKYLFRERRLPVYDIAVAITKYDMCRRRKGGRCTKGTADLTCAEDLTPMMFAIGGQQVMEQLFSRVYSYLLDVKLLIGFAYVGGACVVNKRLEKVNSVAIIEDTGGFSGIIVAAHEVGHLLGAVHDGSPPPSYLGGPGAEKCQWTDGFIMSDLRHTERGFRWSSCSVSSFHHFLNGDTATCLFNSPHEDESLPRVLPGKLLTLDAQCRRDRGTSACFKDDRVCAQLFCFDAGSGYCVAYRPAAEGSACGDGQYCLNGRCVAEHENIIPDYTQNTPTFIRNGNQGRPLFHDDDDQANTPEAPNYYNNYNDYSTQNPYNNQYDYNQYQNPYNQDYYSTTTTTTTQNPYYNTKSYYSTYKPFNYFSISTTKSPYDFHNFGKYSTTTTQRPYNYYTSNNPYSQPQSTVNPYIGNYFNIRRQTTKSPYDFADFGKSTTSSPYNLNYNDNINNNYLKRSYNAASYYSDSSNIRKTNVTVTSGRL